MYSTCVKIFKNKILYYYANIHNEAAFKCLCRKLNNCRLKHKDIVNKF